MPRIIGREVFKTIVSMAYEMELAERVTKKIDKGLLEFSYELKYPTRFRDTSHILEDITEIWKVAHTNKKHYTNDDSVDEDDPEQWYSKKKIDLTTSGPVSAFLRVVKYNDAGIIRAYLDVWMEADEYQPYDDGDNLEVQIHNAPTTTTVAIIQRDIKARIHHELCGMLLTIFVECYDSIKGKSKILWWRRLNELHNQKSRQFLVKL